MLPYKVDGSVSTRSTVVWSRNELKYPNVHVRQHSGDQDEEQNQSYRNRTSMRADSLETGDLSLTLRRPTVGDSGNYTCTIRRVGEVLRQTGVQLLVRGQSEVTLLCRADGPSELDRTEPAFLRFLDCSADSNVALDPRSSAGAPAAPGWCYWYRLRSGTQGYEGPAR